MEVSIQETVDVDLGLKANKKILVLTILRTLRFCVRAVCIVW